MAAPLGLISFTFLNAQGQPLVGAPIEVRKQGATIQSASDAQHINVDDPGGIVIGDVLQRDLTGPTNAVTAVSLNQIVVNAPGFGSITNNARLTCTSPLVQLWADPQGNEAKGNPLSTDSNGFAFAYAKVAPYDLMASGGNAPNGPAPAVLIRDYPALGMGGIFLNMFPISGLSGAMDIDTLRNFGAAQAIIRILMQGAEMWRIHGDGSVKQTGLLHILGGGLQVDGGAITLPNASIPNSALQIGTFADMAYDDDSVDYAITTTPTAIPNVSVAYTPAASTSKLFIAAVVPHETTSNDSRIIIATLFEDATPIAEGKIIHALPTGVTGQAGVISLVAPVRTGSAALRTYTIKISKDAGVSPWLVKNSTDRKARIFVIESKQ